MEKTIVLLPETFTENRSSQLFEPCASIIQVFGSVAPAISRICELFHLFEVRVRIVVSFQDPG